MVQNNYINFTYYLAGLIDGGGSIKTPIIKRNVKYNKNKKYPLVQIIFEKKNLPLVLIIQKNLKYSIIRRKKNSFYLLINNFHGLLNFINLINGKLRSYKIHDLWLMIDWFNQNYSLEIVKLPLNTTFLGSNSWLSGFIEAAGHFYVRTTEPGKYGRKTECKFELEQVQVNKEGYSSYDFMYVLNAFLFSTLNEKKKHTKWPQYRLRTNNLFSKELLCIYLKNYPLFGSKQLDYLNWALVVFYFTRKLQLIKLFKIKELKANMNNKRTVFIWDHLKNFYNIYD